MILINLFNPVFDVHSVVRVRILVGLLVLFAISLILVK